MKHKEKYNLKSLAQDTLLKAQVPLTVEEIWSKAQEFGFDKKLKLLARHHGEQLVRKFMLIYVTMKIVYIFKRRKDQLSLL